MAFGIYRNPPENLSDTGVLGLAEAVCPAGQVITGGGWSMDKDLTVFAALTSSGKWRVYVRNNGIHTRAFQARGMCLGV